MSSSFRLHLDTAAPVVTWGAVTGASITETLTVEYIINEPEVVSAELELADNRRVAMAVAPTQLSAVVPEDAPEGWGRILALVRDVAGNSATRELAVQISGVLGPPPTTPTAPPTLGGLPTPAFATRDFGVSRARVSDRFTVTAVATTTGRVRARSSYTPPPTRARRFTGSLRLESSYTVGRPGSFGASSASLSSGATVIRRGDGPEAMDELMLLDLL